jgi:hypothetical protein
MGLLVSGCWLELVSSARSGEDQSLVFMSAWPVLQSYILTSLSLQERPPGTHHEPLDEHEALLTTTDGHLGLDCGDELWRECVDFGWHFPNAAFDIVVVLRFFCSEDGVVQSDTQRDFEKLANERLGIVVWRHHSSRLTAQHSTTACDISTPCLQCRGLILCRTTCAWCLCRSEAADMCSGCLDLE